MIIEDLKKFYRFKKVGLIFTDKRKNENYEKISLKYYTSQQKLAKSDLKSDFHFKWSERFIY